MEAARQLAHQYVDALPEKSVAKLLDFLKYYQAHEEDDECLKAMCAMCMEGLAQEWDNPDDEVWNDV